MSMLISSYEGIVLFWVETPGLSHHGRATPLSYIYSARLKALYVCKTTGGWTVGYIWLIVMDWGTSKIKNDSSK
jgi:hypothetical protein